MTQTTDNQAQRVIVAAGNYRDDDTYDWVEVVDRRRTSRVVYPGGSLAQYDPQATSLLGDAICCYSVIAPQ